MRFIRKDGVIVKNLSKQERLPLVKKAYCEEGKTQKQIAEELMVVEATISKDLSYLREIGEIDQGLIEKRRNSKYNWSFYYDYIKRFKRIERKWRN